jgi:hypothetical protein
MTLAFCGVQLYNRIFYLAPKPPIKKSGEETSAKSPGEDFHF